MLIGDIVDLLRQQRTRYIKYNCFLTSLLKVKIDKIIYIAGNHDYHFQVEMLKIIIIKKVMMSVIQRLRLHLKT